MSWLEMAGTILATLLGVVGFCLSVSALSMPRVPSFYGARRTAWLFAAIAIVLGLLLVSSLGGCTHVENFTPYAPQEEIVSAKVYIADLNACRTYALAYKPGLSATDIGTAAISGAGQNAAGAAVNAYVPVIGAAGSATSETFEELGLTQTKRIKVFVSCLKEKTRRDGSALVLDPND